MRWLIFWEGCYVGAVDAASAAEALTRADERFGPIHGTVEAVPAEPGLPWLSYVLMRNAALGAAATR